MSEKLSLNLLPNRAKFQARKNRLKQRVNQVSLIIGVMWVVGVMVVGGVWFLHDNQWKEAQKKYERSQKSYQSLTGAILKNQKVIDEAKVAAKILSERFEYSTIFKEMRKFLPPDAKIEKMDLNNERTGFIIAAEVIRDEDVEAVEKQVIEVNHNQNELFQKATLNTLVLSNNGWKFEMEVKLK